MPGLLAVDPGEEVDGQGEEFPAEEEDESVVGGDDQHHSDREQRVQRCRRPRSTPFDLHQGDGDADEPDHGQEESAEAVDPQRRVAVAEPVAEPDARGSPAAGGSEAARPDQHRAGGHAQRSGTSGRE